MSGKAIKDHVLLQQQMVDAIRESLGLEPLYNKSQISNDQRFLTLPPELPFVQATRLPSNGH